MNKRMALTPPSRVHLCHTPPSGVHNSSALYFITICAARRESSPLLPLANEIIKSARFRHHRGIWFLALFLVMPDHIHMLVHIPEGKNLNQVIGDWKHYVAATLKIEFQKNFFDTRIRDAEHYEEKWNYIMRNPVVRGLVATPREWPYVIAFNRATGEELRHK